jgi:hypothetical protein
MTARPDDARILSSGDGGALERTGRMLLVSKHLLLFTLATLVATVAVFGIGLWFDRFPMSWFCFECGIIGGFVSIQQRLKRVSDEELTYLSQSWTAILVVPVFGGVFALVLYILFLAGIVEGSLFPKITIPPFTTGAPPTITDLRRFFTETYPASGPDFAKLTFWCFVAGFSERFVPQIIQRVSDRGEQDAGLDRQPGGRPRRVPLPAADTPGPGRTMPPTRPENPEQSG